MGLSLPGAVHGPSIQIESFVVRSFAGASAGVKREFCRQIARRSETPRRGEAAPRGRTSPNNTTCSSRLCLPHDTARTHVTTPLLTSAYPGSSEGALPGRLPSISEPDSGSCKPPCTAEPYSGRLRPSEPGLRSLVAGASGHAGCSDGRLAERIHGSCVFPSDHQPSADQRPPLHHSSHSWSRTAQLPALKPTGSVQHGLRVLHVADGSALGLLRLYLLKLMLQHKRQGIPFWNYVPPPATRTAHRNSV